jgi:hypothetical protein
VAVLVVAQEAVTLVVLELLIKVMLAETALVKQVQAVVAQVALAKMLPHQAFLVMVVQV